MQLSLCGQYPGVHCLCIARLTMKSEHHVMKGESLKEMVSKEELLEA